MSPTTVPPNLPSPNGPTQEPTNGPPVTGSPGRKLILLALRAADRPMGAADLAPVTELPTPRVAELLGELGDAGLVVSDDSGRYTPTTPGSPPGGSPEYDRDTCGPGPTGMPLPAGVSGYPVGARHPRLAPGAGPDAGPAGNAAGARYTAPQTAPGARSGAWAGGA